MRVVEAALVLLPSCETASQVDVRWNFPVNKVRKDCLRDRVLECNIGIGDGRESLAGQESS